MIVRASDSPESGIGASHTSLPESDDAPPPYYDTELLPPLGTCKALYPFEGKIFYFSLQTVSYRH